MIKTISIIAALLFSIHCFIMMSPLIFIALITKPNKIS